MGMTKAEDRAEKQLRLYERDVVAKERAAKSLETLVKLLEPTTTFDVDLIKLAEAKGISEEDIKRIFGDNITEETN